MAHPTTHSHHRPRKVRARSERAQGLEPELTAQPHPFSEELGLVMHDDGALSIAPEDLGSHFLAEALEQGDLGAGEYADLEQALIDAENDPDDAPRSEAEFAAWANMVERAAKGDGVAELLREVAAEATDALEAESELPRESVPSGPVRLDDSIVREVSLLDREGAGLDETVTPEVDLDDTGRHARMTSRGALGEQIGDRRPRRGAADGGGKRITLATRAGIGKAAGKIRSIAKKIARAR
jgi:hypothetical protein